MIEYPISIGDAHRALVTQANAAPTNRDVALIATDILPKRLSALYREWQPSYGGYLNNSLWDRSCLLMYDSADRTSVIDGTWQPLSQDRLYSGTYSARFSGPAEIGAHLDSLQLPGVCGDAWRLLRPYQWGDRRIIASMEAALTEGYYPNPGAWLQSDCTVHFSTDKQTWQTSTKKNAPDRIKNSWDMVGRAGGYYFYSDNDWRVRYVGSIPVGNGWQMKIRVNVTNDGAELQNDIQTLTFSGDEADIVLNNDVVDAIREKISEEKYDGAITIPLLYGYELRIQRSHYTSL